MLSKDDEDRIAGRKWAEEVFDDVPKQTKAFQTGFRREVRRRIKRQVTVEAQPMTDKQAREFGKGRIEFGKYKGYMLEVIPLEYLEWLADQGVMLHRYLLSLKDARGG